MTPSGQISGTRRVEHVMGMPIIVDLCDDKDDNDALLDELFEWFRHVDTTFSTYKSDSAISLIRRGALDSDDASAEVRDVLARCRQLGSETDGYFDPWRCSPDGLDPSGFVKGWAVDEAAAILTRAGRRAFAINAAGDMRLHGRTWRVGIQHPLERNAVAKVVEAEDLAIATSGAYERGTHVRDPHTGDAPSGVLSVTICGPELAIADAYATAAFAMGVPRAIHWTARLRGYDALTITADGRVLATPGFPAC